MFKFYDIIIKIEYHFSTISNWYDVCIRFFSVFQMNNATYSCYIED